MNTQTVVSISDARALIFDIAKKVQRPGTHFTLTEKGRPKAVVMSAEEFESWRETIETIHDIPDLKKDIREARRDFTSGAYKKYVTLEELMAKEYGVSGTHQTTRAKRV